MIITMCRCCFAAGHETTANLMASAGSRCCSTPTSSNGSLIILTSAPKPSMSSCATTAPSKSPPASPNDLTLGGVSVRKGQQAVVVLGAANRDPARYPDPDRLDLTRTGVPHLAFRNRPHFCVGAGLARLEAQETFNRLAQSAFGSRADSWSHSRELSRTFRRLRSLRVADNQPRGRDSARRAAAAP